MDLQVTIADGVLEGEILESSLGGSYYSFKGIPFARPPLGDLRFKAPQPPEPWDGVRSAKKHGPFQYQFDMFSQSIIGDGEDCLYLNVYSRDIKPSQPLPVMVWINSGGFMSGRGDSDFYGPDFLMTEDVVLVTFNYRLGVLGFLSLETKDIPGNAGMKDQVAALRWVKRNIAKFGGNPDNITIFGNSAGGGSCAFHLVSPMTKGLFKRAILQSGNALSQWGMAFEPRQRAIALARQLGFYSENDEDLYIFFKNIPIESITNVRPAITMAEELQSNVYLHFTIVDEKLFGNNERFFYGNIFEHMRSGIHEGVDVMTGYTEDEGYLSFGLVPLPHILKTFNKYIELFCPIALTYKLPIKDQIDIGREMRRYYYRENWNITINNLEPMSKYTGTELFKFGAIQTIKFIAKKKLGNVYMYKFTYYSERNDMANKLGAKEAVEATPKNLASHCDEMMYLFDNKEVGIAVNVGSDSYHMIKKMISLWTNFAKHGNPTPNEKLGVQWLPYTLDKESYLDIGNQLIVRTSPDREEIDFWESIYRNYCPQNLAFP